MAKPGKPQQGSAVKVVEALVRPVVEGMDLRLWDVRFEKEGPDWFLRVLIDRDEPLDTDTCEAVSRAIDPLLDEADPIEQSYYLEVGSPGLGRRLTRPEHYEQLKGRKCAAHLIRPDEQGRRDYAGILQGLDADGNVTLTDGEETYAFPVKSAATSSSATTRICSAEKKLPLRGKLSAKRTDEGKPAVIAHDRAATAQLPLIRPCGATFPQGEAERL